MSAHLVDGPEPKALIGRWIVLSDPRLLVVVAFVLDYLRSSRQRLDLNIPLHPGGSFEYIFTRMPTLISIFLLGAQSLASRHRRCQGKA